jgi:hypothetical protein
LALLSGVALSLALNASAKPTVACFIETPVRSTDGFGVKYRFADTGGYSYGTATDPNKRWEIPSFAEYHMRKLQEAGVDVVIHDGTNWDVTVK